MSTSAGNQNLDRTPRNKQAPNPPAPTDTAKKNFTAVKWSNDKGEIIFGDIHKKGDVTAGISLKNVNDGRHNFCMDVDGQRRAWSTHSVPGNYQVVAGMDNEEPDDTIMFNAENGNIDIIATNGKIRLQATDIELVAVGEGGARGHITCSATETFTVHKTKKIILQSKTLTSITSPGIVNLAANSCLKMYSSIIRGVTDAVKDKDSKVGGQKLLEENNQA